jgi:hypothetical protein
LQAAKSEITPSAILITYLLLIFKIEATSVASPFDLGALQDSLSEKKDK